VFLLSEVETILKYPNFDQIFSHSLWSEKPSYLQGSFLSNQPNASKTKTSSKT